MENELLEKLIESYKLSEDEHRMILNELKKRVFLNRVAEKDPSIMFVIGQPGCGKQHLYKILIYLDIQL